MAGDLSAALLRLDEITRLLRRECPWDREQDERSIVPHTIEEAYELADAAHSGDDAKLLDELGDVLFQVYFLSLLLEERGRGSLAEVAERPYGVLELELPLRHREGHQCTVQFTITNLLDNPSVGGLVLNTRDVSERRQLERLAKWKANRNQEQVDARLADLRKAAEGDSNLLPPIKEALRAGGSIGEVCNAMREVFGEYKGGAFF